MQTARDVAPALFATELNDHVENRETALQGKGAGRLGEISRDACSAGLDRDGSARLDRGGQKGRLSRLELIHSAVKYLPDHEMQAFGSSNAGVHALSCSNRLEALKDIGGGESVSVEYPSGVRRGGHSVNHSVDYVSSNVTGRAAGLVVTEPAVRSRRNRG